MPLLLYYWKIGGVAMGNRGDRGEMGTAEAEVKIHIADTAGKRMPRGLRFLFYHNELLYGFPFHIT